MEVLFEAPFEGPFDSDEASEAIAALEIDEQDVAAAMFEALSEFLVNNEDFVEEGSGDEALAFACLIAARVSGIAPDEAAHHWLDRNPFTVPGELRRVAAAAFTLATRTEDNSLSESTDPGYWSDFLTHLEPYRKALYGELQEVPAPFVPDYSEPWFHAYLDHGREPSELTEAINDSPAWLEWWIPSGLQELTVYGDHDPGEYGVRISRGRITAEGWFKLDGTDAEFLTHALSELGDYLGLGTIPPIEAVAP